MRELMSYLPENYRDSRETAAFQEALQPEANAIWEVRDDLLAQLIPYTATWGLDYWEDALAIRNARHLDVEQRRQLVAAKLQGRGATTPHMVRTVAEAVLGVPVTVVEHYGLYRVELAVDAGFRPGPWMVPLREQLDQIMPAHLDWAFVIPTLVQAAVSTPLGVRGSRTALAMHRGTLRPIPAGTAAALGLRASRTALPMFRGRLLPGILGEIPLLGVKSSATTLKNEGG